MGTTQDAELPVRVAVKAAVSLNVVDSPCTFSVTSQAMVEELGIQLSAMLIWNVTSIFPVVAEVVGAASGAAAAGRVWLSPATQSANTQPETKRILVKLRCIG
jgi:hypothetical protein